MRVNKISADTIGESLISWSSNQYIEIHMKPSVNKYISQ